MFKKICNAFYLFICAVLTIQLAGCGTLMYPERKGQRSGRIDAGIAVLDGVGLLFFLIPGVIAYAVDFSNGTIYLPGALHASLGTTGFKVVKFDPRHKTQADIAGIIKRETGCDIALYQGKMRIARLRSSEDMLVHFAQVAPGAPHEKIALLGQ